MEAPFVPPVELEAPRGGRIVVAPRSPEDRLAELADALGLRPGEDLDLDGRPASRHETLERAGLRRGSQLAPAASSPDPQEAQGAPVVTVIVDAGPASGGLVALGPGRHVLGRSPAAAVCLADPLLEPHHALLDVDADGDVRIVQLTGRVPVRIGGQPVAGSTIVDDGATVELGASRLRIGRSVEPREASPAVTVASADPWRRSLLRTPSSRPQWDPAPAVLPAGVPPGRVASGIGLTAAFCTMLGSVVIALVMRSPMFILLGATGVLASIGMWIVGRVHAARDGRRAGAIRERDMIGFRAAVAEQRAARWEHHLTTTPTIATALTVAEQWEADLWARRAGHGDAFRVTLGWGRVWWDVAVGRRPADTTDTIAAELLAVIGAAECFDDAPVPADVGPGAAIAVSGPQADAVVRSIAVQLATWTGPADWQLVVVADNVGDWEWCSWLPHGPSGAATVVNADGVDAMTLAALDGGGDDERHVVVVTDRPDLLAQRTGPLRRYLGTGSAAVVVHVRSGEAVPALCRSVLEVGSVGRARWWSDATDGGQAETLHAAGITRVVATRAARALAALLDPEDPAASSEALSASVSLGALCARHGAGPIDDAIAIAATWRAAGPDPAPIAPLGLTADGVVEIDLAGDGPHALIAGTTGAGKSELLRTLVVSLAARCSPEHLSFILIDYKGGATFDACAELPHTVGLVTDLDDRLAERALTSLEAELRRREHLLRAVGASDLRAYRTDPERPPIARLVVVIDEFAALAAELPSFLPSLVGVAQRGRSLGVHLVLATQRPGGVVDDDIRANTNLRLALRLVDTADARDVVGDDGPTRFLRNSPGRTMLRLGPHETIVFQSARCTGPVPDRGDAQLRVVVPSHDAGHEQLTELAVMVRSIRHAAALSDCAPAHRPWLPPLPAPLVGRPPNGAIGLIDVPARQGRDELRWSPTSGHVVLLGALGSGTTTALVAVARAACDESAPERRHLYVVDGRGDERLDALTSAAHCGGVVRLHEAERLGRLLDRLVDELDRRRTATADGDARPEIFVAIDGLPALHATLDQPGDAPRWAQVLRVVSEGPGVGITCVFTAERPGAMPPAVLAACAERWVFHLDDPSEAAVSGVRARAVPEAVPGRLVVASTGLEAQVAMADLANETSARSPVVGGPPPIGVLATLVDSATLPQGRRTGTGDVELVVGIDFRSLDVARLIVPDGEHVLIAGPSRSGRTTALRRLVQSWSEAAPDGIVVAVSARRHVADWPNGIRAVDAAGMTEIVDGASGRACLVVVDDAEHVDDSTGRLTAVVSERRPGVLVIATGRPQALRPLYGHWTAVVRRSRLGLLMSACEDTDGDVLGELLPRHRPVPARPGLAWIVSAGRRSLAQVGLTVNASRHDSLRPVCSTERS